ncbi:MAG: VWA domain-containing protein [Microthrixaceae bacterium]
MSENPTDRTDSNAPDAAEVHLYVLLDRSGSMASIADDVIGGYNRLLADQRGLGSRTRITLVQFDSNNPQEVVADAVPVSEVLPLEHETFVPRGSTPLLDATGRLIARATARQHQHAALGHEEEIVFVSITDGHENASQELTLPAVRKMIDERTEAGWTFVFLSAALDVYGEATSLGYDPRSAQSFTADAEGVHLAMDSLSRSVGEFRQDVLEGRTFDKGDFFRDDKAAEEDRRRRGSDG